MWTWISCKCLSFLLFVTIIYAQNVAENTNLLHLYYRLKQHWPDMWTCEYVNFSEESVSPIFKVADTLWMVLYINIYTLNTPSSIQIMCGYIILNSEGVGKESYTILSEDNLKKFVKQLNRRKLSLST
jgi:hypothetical protein